MSHEKCNKCYEGVNCNQTIDPCSKNSCKNNGNCVSNTNDCTYSCVCPKGFSGNNCEKDANPCLNIICLNGGTCVENDQGG